MNFNATYVIEAMDDEAIELRVSKHSWPLIRRIEKRKFAKYKFTQKELDRLNRLALECFNLGVKKTEIIKKDLIYAVISQRRSIKKDNEAIAIVQHYRLMREVKRIKEVLNV